MAQRRSPDGWSWAQGACRGRDRGIGLTMNLPKLDNPSAYVGHYVVDFGSQCAVGYTAAEVAALLESERFSEVDVYRIVRASPDGGMELVGVPAARFQMEDIFLFVSRRDVEARRDFEQLCELSERETLPARAAIQLAHWSATAHERFGVAMIYPAEFEHAFSQYLLGQQYSGGEVVEAGPSVLARYRREATVLQRVQRWGRDDLTSRPARQVLAELDRPIQRVIA